MTVVPKEPHPFGTGGAFHRTLTRPVVDAQWSRWAHDGVLPDDRWHDRVLSDKNLIRTWQELAGHFADHASTPFELDPETMTRRDAPLGYTAFREAAINLLIHQDYADPRSASIRLHPDRWIFENPGTAIVPSGRLFEPGEKPYRNSQIAIMFVRIGLSERTSSGLRAIYGDWRRMGRAPPIVDDDRDSYTFRLTLGVEPLMTSEQILFRGRMNLHLSPEAALALAILVQRESIIDRELAAAIGVGGRDLEKVLAELQTQVVAELVSAQDGRRVRLAPHLRERWPLTASAQVESAEPASLSEMQLKVLLALDTPAPMSEIEAMTGESRDAVRRLIIAPLRKAKLITLQSPEKPSSRNQRYVLTPLGAELVATQMRKEGDRG